MNRPITTEELLSGKRGVCDLETRSLDYQQVTKVPKKAELFVNIIYKAGQEKGLKIVKKIQCVGRQCIVQFAVIAKFHKKTAKEVGTNEVVAL